MSLIAKGLKFAYPNGALLLDGLDLLVPDGQSAAVMAPSGIGKSTLLSVLGGLNHPSEGYVKITGSGVTTDGPAHLDGTQIAWVFQSMHLLTTRTALDNVAVAVMPKGVRRNAAETLARAELARFGVGELADRPVRLLSGGQRQRVALARASAADPAVVLADEPTANLDHDNALAVAKVLVNGFPRASVVIATHDSTVAAMTSVSYMMRDGRLDVKRP
jgi:ABC-type lipoprotein export system ATPase subunit